LVLQSAPAPAHERRPQSRLHSWRLSSASHIDLRTSRQLQIAVSFCGLPWGCRYFCARKRNTRAHVEQVSTQRTSPIPSTLDTISRRTTPEIRRHCAPEAERNVPEPNLGGASAMCTAHKRWCHVCGMYWLLYVEFCHDFHPPLAACPHGENIDLKHMPGSQCPSPTCPNSRSGGCAPS
jgi:hypothetical protein